MSDCVSIDTVAKRGAEALALAACMLVSACGEPTVADGTVRDVAAPASDDRRSRIDPARSGSISDIFAGPVPNTNISIGSGEGEALRGAPVNRHIWRASLDTLDFLPIASTDPYSGVIATDWGGSVAAPNERVKVTAYVESVELSPNALRVAVFREVRDENGAWTPATVAPETPRKLEDAILTRARQLRIEEENAG